MKLAAAAYPIEWHDRWNDYVGRLRLWVRTAAEQGAQLALFPEHAGLELASLAEESNAKDAARSVEAVSARRKDVDDLHSSLSREFGLHICAATAPVRRETGTVVSRARLFAPDGSRGFQDKLVPTRHEREVWGITPADGLRVFDTSIGRIGILVGQDVVVPGIARALAGAGADILLMPASAATARGYWRLRIAGVARALETGCVVVHSVAVGDASWSALAPTWTGAAGIYAPPEAGLPEDGMIAVGKLNAVGWVYGDPSLEALASARGEAAAADALDWSDPDARLSEIAVVSLRTPPEPAPAVPVQAG